MAENAFGSEHQQLIFGFGHLTNELRWLLVIDTDSPRGRIIRVARLNLIAPQQSFVPC